MTFDIEAERAALASFAIGYHRDTLYEDALPNAVGNSARMGLETAVLALLVGMRDEGQALAWKFRDWLEDSIGRDEIFGRHPDYDAALRHEAYALAVWLTDDQPGREHLMNGLDRFDGFLEDPHEGSRAIVVSDHAARYLRDCLLADDRDRAAAFLERHAIGPGDGDPTLQLAAGLLAGAPGAPSAADRVIARSLQQDWIPHGQAVDGLLWVRMLFHATGRAETVEAVLDATLAFLTGAGDGSGK